MRDNEYVQHPSHPLAKTFNHRGMDPDSSAQGPQAHQQHAAVMPDQAADTILGIKHPTSTFS
jgi:hypothetical protein